jgi:hypothetical protein
MNSVAGNAVATEDALLANVILTPPAGAGAPNETGRLTVFPAATTTVEGSRMPPAAGCVTVTLALAAPTFGALALIVADPAATLVTATATLLAPAAKLTDAGTVATPGALELMLTVRGEEAAAERLSVICCVATPFIVRLPGEKLRLADGVGPLPVT